MKKAFALVVILSGVVVLSGCSPYGGNSTNPTVIIPAPASTQGINNINIQNFAFNPATLTVKKGATVTWTNNDSASHQIKSATFNSGSFGKGQSFSFTFNDAGTFDYFCAIHPSMLGKIAVE